MTEETTTLSPARWSNETVLDLVRTIRNDLIKDFLDERFLLEYLSTTFRMKDLSRRKLEFVRADLKDMLIAPVDIKHYAPLMKLLEETGTMAITAGNEALFYKEIEQILKRHLF